MRKYQLAGALFALISVVLGAFASHLLKAYLGTEQLHSFETGTRYMMYHGLALLLLFCCMSAERQFPCGFPDTCQKNDSLSS